MEFGTKNLKTGAKLLLKLRLEESLKVDEEFQYLFLVALRVVSEAKGELALQLNKPMWAAKVFIKYFQALAILSGLHLFLVRCDGIELLIILKIEQIYHSVMRVGVEVLGVNLGVIRSKFMIESNTILASP